MKKFLLVLVVSVLDTFAGMYAQNNPYQLQDSCYVLFVQAEKLVGKEGFQEVNEALLQRALALGDKKSETLYYIERLRNATRSIPSGSSTDSQDTEILSIQEEAKEMADANGFPQYFYYSYEIVQNYFYNHGKTIRTMELLLDLQETARQRGDSYGLWMSQRYMLNLYLAQGDYINAKSYLQKAIQTYHESKDPIVKRQSISRLYCDLSDTYVIGSDSVGINVRNAVNAAVTHLDSLRCAYYLAKLAAYEKRHTDFQRNRDYCLNDPQITTISQTAPLVLKTLDSIIDGQFDANSINQLSAARTREIKFIANVAEKYLYEEQGFEIEKLLVRKYELQMATINRSRTAEMDARLDNAVLQGELASKKEEAANISRMVLVLAIAILIAVMAFLIIHLRTLDRHNRKLLDANKKALMADEAKTRFVQNMSHEVRTPLNTIVGFSQLLSLPDGSLSEEDKEAFASHILDNTQMLTKLLDDILNASATSPEEE